MEFGPNISDFQKHPGKLYHPVRADLHPPSQGFANSCPRFRGRRPLSKRQARSGPRTETGCAVGMAVTSFSPAERRFALEREREASLAKSESRALGGGFLGSCSCRSISIPYLRDLWVIAYWPRAGTAALRAFSGCAGTFITWGQMSADYLIQMIKYTSHSILHHSPCESSCSAIWQLPADNFWETDFKLWG